MASVNIKDIARIAGVGVSTVSRVINQHPDVNEETKRMVQRVIEETNYVPNNAARNLKRRESKSIGVLIKGISNPFFAPMIKVIEKQLNASGYAMILQQVESNASEVDAALELTKEKRLQGLIFLGGMYEQSREKLALIHIPLVLTTITTFGSAERAMFSSVTVDDKKEAHKAVSYLCSLGHQRIAIITGTQSDLSISKLRLEGYKQALRDHLLEFDPSLVAYTNDFNMHVGYGAAMGLLGARRDFTGIFAVADTLAIGACRAALDLGLRVPQDISVIGFDGLELSRYYNPTLTTISQPAEEMAHSCVELLLDVIEQEKPHQHLVFAAELLKGGSCAALN